MEWCFTGNAIYSFDDSVKRTHILQFLTITNKTLFFTSPQEKEIQMNQIWRMRGLGNGSPSSYPTIRKLLVQKGSNTTAKSGVVAYVEA
jgi:hypothetical protein